MSYDIELCDPVTKEPIEIENAHFMTGGTYALGGTKKLKLNITYNYSRILHDVLGEGGIRSLYGKTGHEAIPLLNAAIAKLKDDVTDDYWLPTEGNVKSALLKVLAMSHMRPDGKWDGD